MIYVVPPVIILTILGICSAFVSALNFDEHQFGWAVLDAALSGAAFGMVAAALACLAADYLVRRHLDSAALDGRG